MSDGKVYKTSEAGRAYNKAYREANKEKIKAYQKAYREANNETLKAQNKAWYEANQDHVKAYRETNRDKQRARDRARWRDNKERELARGKAYRESNKDEINSRARARYQINKESEKARGKAYREAYKDEIKARREVNKDVENAKRRAIFASNIPQKLLRLAKSAYKRVAGKSIKKQEIIDILGCTFEEHKEYLESKFQPGMTWENHKHNGWHIDHILPLNESEVSEEEKLKRLHYTNTQPLWAEDNHSKGNNRVYNPEN